MRNWVGIAAPAFLVLALLAGLVSWGGLAGSLDAQTVEPLDAGSEGHCANAYVADLAGWVEIDDDDGSSVVELEWSYDIAPWPEGDLEVFFRVERRMADAGEWELVDSGRRSNVFVSAGEPGVWIYRVSIASVVIGDSVEECSFDVAAADETRELRVPTREEWAKEFLVELCDVVEVTGLKVVMPEVAGPGNNIMLKWDDGMDYLRMYEDEWPFLPDVVHFGVERVAAADVDDEAWVRLGETERKIWSGPADYGHWFYRVGTVRLEGAGATQECHPWWNSIEVRLLTPAEQEEHERRVGVLETEAVRCGTERLTVNFQGDAKQVVGDYVADRVGDLIAEYDDYTDPDEVVGEMVRLAVLLCADSDEPSPHGVEFGSVWATLALLEDGPYWLW